MTLGELYDMLPPGTRFRWATSDLTYVKTGMPDVATIEDSNHGATMRVGPLRDCPAKSIRILCRGVTSAHESWNDRHMTPLARFGALVVGTRFYLTSEPHEVLVKTDKFGARVEATNNGRWLTWLPDNEPNGTSRYRVVVIPNEG